MNSPLTENVPLRSEGFAYVGAQLTQPLMACIAAGIKHLHQDKKPETIQFVITDGFFGSARCHNKAAEDLTNALRGENDIRDPGTFNLVISAVMTTALRDLHYKRSFQALNRREHLVTLRL